MFKYTVDSASEIKRLQKIERQIPYATSVALNKTAYVMRDRLKEKITQVFDRPTPYTQRALWVRKANKNRLEAEVKLKDFGGKGTAATKYLWPQVHGGKRQQKRYEKALSRVGPTGYYVPAGGAKIDAYGNMSRGEIVKLMSYLEAFSEQGFRANSTPNTRARMARNRVGKHGYKQINGVQYFFSRGKGSMSGNREQTLTAGVWAKKGIHGVDVKPVLFLTKNDPSYMPLLPFYETAEEVYSKHFESEYRTALDLAISTAK